MLALLFGSIYGEFLEMKGRLFLLGITFICTFIFPLSFVAILRKMGKVSSFSMRERRERILPLLFGAFMCYINYNFFEKAIAWLPVFPKLLGWLCLFLIVLAFITLFWKISLHLSAAGGLLGILIHFSLYPWLTMLMVLIVGLIGTSRLWLKAHNSSQIYVGFLFGLSYFLACFLLFL